MVNMGDDAEVSDLRRVGEGLVGETADGNLLMNGWYVPSYRPVRPVQTIERRP
jgi:hypothetical protein